MTELHHMVEFTATRIEDKQEDCWCVLVFTDIHEEYLHEMERNVEMSHWPLPRKEAYEMLIAANLTKNSYYMMEYDRFKIKKAPEAGNFDDLIQVGASTMDRITGSRFWIDSPGRRFWRRLKEASGILSWRSAI